MAHFMCNTEYLSESNICLCENVDTQCLEDAANKLHVNFFSVRLGWLGSARILFPFSLIRLFIILKLVFF